PPPGCRRSARRLPVAGPHGRRPRPPARRAGAARAWGAGPGNPPAQPLRPTMRDDRRERIVLMNAPWWRPAATQQYTSISTRTDGTRSTPDEPDTDLLPPFID